MSKTIIQLQQEYRDAKRALEEAEKEMKAAMSKETAEMQVLVGATVIDARFYEEAEGMYRLKFFNPQENKHFTVMFSAQGDDMTSVTIDIEEES